MAIALNRFKVFRLSSVQLSALQQDGLDPSGLWAVGVLFGLTFGMMLTVDGYPLRGNHACAQQ